MAPLSTNRIAWTYTDDAGNAWRVAAQKALTDQGVLGGAAAADTVPQIPGFFRKRRTTVSNAAGNSRVVICYEKTATILTPGTTINVNVLGNSTAMTSNGVLLNEGSSRHNVTKQAT